MSINDNENPELPQVPELDTLKERATRLGISFHPSIGVDTLRSKINARLADTGSIKPKVEEPAAVVKPGVESKEARLSRKRKEATRLVRVRISCMNPDKKAWPGEILTVSNSVIGSLRKFIPFNNEEGWHIPHMMYQHMKERECQIFVKTKGPRGRDVITPKMIKEFSVELLPDLTYDEIKALAQRQAMANGTQVA